jgi:mono/diheme cytochrome c family protein
LKPILLALALPALASAAPSIWDGVYTAEQAARGKKLYAENCADCHGDDLKTEDDKVKVIAGEAFLKRWDGKTLGKLIDNTKRSMPPDTPNSLSRPDTAALIAYVLSVNGVRAGKTEIDPTSPVLKEIVIEPKK